MQVRVASICENSGIINILYLDDNDGFPIVFGSVKEALRYLRDRNYTLPEICELDFEIEEE